MVCILVKKFHHLLVELLLLPLLLRFDEEELPDERVDVFVPVFLVVLLFVVGVWVFCVPNI